MDFEHDQGRDRYPSALRWLHWLVVMLLIAQFAIAWTMPDVKRGTLPTGLISWHLSVGILIWLVMAARLCVRAASAVPQEPTDLPPALSILARGTHYTLYALLLVLPVLGYINASGRGWNVRLFGIGPLPQLASPHAHWAMAMGDVHKTAALVLLAVVALHVSGALYHALVLRDGTLRRILPG